MKLGKQMAALALMAGLLAGPCYAQEASTSPSTSPSTMPDAAADGATTAPTGAPTTQDANRPATLAELKAQNKADSIGQWVNLPSLPPRAVEDLFRIHLVDGNLILNSPLTDRELLPTQIPLTDMRGNSRLLVHHVQGAPGGIAAMTFTNWDFTNPKVVFTMIEVLAQPNFIQIVRNVEYPDQKILMVSLNQNYAIGSPLTLRVQVTWENSGGIPFNLAVSGANVIELRREHPAEFEKYLRPIFHTLRQEKSIFGVDDEAAWQVLADTWVCPPDVPDKVKPVVAQLNADDYAIRAKAMKDLRAMGRPAALYLLTMSRAGLSPEQNGQIDTLLRPYHQFSDEQAIQLRHDVDFLLDCLYSDDIEVRNAALEHLSAAVGHRVELETGSTTAPSDPVARLRDELVPSLETE